jgi:hypothetical protein
MRRQIERLPPALQYDYVYLREDFWRAFLAWKHKECRTIRATHFFLLGNAAPDYDDEEEDDEMEDVPPATLKMEALVRDDCGEEGCVKG